MEHFRERLVFLYETQLSASVPQTLLPYPLQANQESSVTDNGTSPPATGIVLFHTILAENGVNPKTVMERLGHKDIKTTLQTYTFNTEMMQTKAVEIFESAIINQ